MKETERSSSQLTCRCDDLSRVRVVDFAPIDEDELTLPPLEHVARAAVDLWWLSYRRCKVCGRKWLVAQEERINDVYVIRELSQLEASEILGAGKWPDDFSRYETLIRLGHEAGHSARFVDTRCDTLIRTTRDILADRPTIANEELERLLNVSADDAAWLREAAQRFQQ
jgi:hypothetical protein